MVAIHIQKQNRKHIFELFVDVKWIFEQKSIIFSTEKSKIVEWGYSNKLLMLIEHMAEVDNK